MAFFRDRVGVSWVTYADGKVQEEVPTDDPVRGWADRLATLDCPPGQVRRRAGSFCSCQRCNASAQGLAYLANDATEICPDLAISMGVEAPFSAS